MIEKVRESEPSPIPGENQEEKGCRRGRVASGELGVNRHLGGKGVFL